MTAVLTGSATTSGFGCSVTIFQHIQNSDHEVHAELEWLCGTKCWLFPGTESGYKSATLPNAFSGVFMRYRVVRMPAQCTSVHQMSLSLLTYSSRFWRRSTAPRPSQPSSHCGCWPTRHFSSVHGIGWCPFVVFNGIHPPDGAHRMYSQCD
jgi:hypothetical protein